MPPRNDVTGRPTALRDLDLTRFFEPRVIAVVGASESTGSQAALNFKLLRGWQEPRDTTIVPVNPKRETVAGLRSYPTLLDVPLDVDLVVILVPDPLPALRDAVEKKVPFAVLFAAGFAESGDEGAGRQAQVLALVDDSEMHVLGPNTTVNAWQPFRHDLPGKRIGLITQSGHQGRPLFQAQEIGIPLQGWAPTGNEADLESADFIKWYADQPEVGAIAMYIEGFKDGRTLALAGDHALARGVPITTIKVGRTDLGRSWTQTHSGHLAGSDAVMCAFFRQYGITRVDGLDELLDVSMMFARCEPPQGDGVAIYSISGGTSAHMADWAGAMGLNVPPLTQRTQDALHEWIPGFLRVSNPVDSGGIATGDERGPKILDAILADPNVAVLVVPIAGSFSPISDRFAADIVAAAAKTTKPVCVIWGSPLADEDGYRTLRASQLPVFRSARNCLTAVKAYLDYHAFRARYRSPFAKPIVRPLPAARTARDLLTPGRALSEHRSKEVLRTYGIPVSDDVLCGSAAEAVRAADRIGYPVVMKPSSPSLLHKSDLGLVRVGVRNAKEVRAAYASLVEASPADVEGVLVCEMVTGGVETILGVIQDELFGPVVMLGLGGVAVEVFRDVTFRVPPFDKAEAHAMIDDLRSVALLKGARGAPKANLGALADAIMRLQRLAMDLSSDIAEIDVNPLVVRPDGAVALDALVVAR